MKIKQILLFILVSSTLALAISSCKKETSSTSASSLGFQIQALTKSFSLPVPNGSIKSEALATNAMVTWDTASMLVSQVKYEAEMKAKITASNMNMEDKHHHGFSKDSVKIEFAWNGPQRINLFDVNTFLGNFTFSPGFYDEVELNVKGLKSDAGNNPVFYLAGTFKNSGGVDKHVIVSINENVLFKTEQDSVTVSGTGVDFTSVIQIYLDKLMKNIPVTSLDNAAVLSNGNILISATSNTELYNTILHNLRLDHPCHHKEGLHHGN